MGSCCCNWQFGELVAFQYVDDSADCPDSMCATPFWLDVTNPDDCEALCATALVSCCIPGPFFECIDEDIVSAAACAANGGVAFCPRDCQATNCEDLLGDSVRPCCLPDGTCEVMTADECSFFNGYRQPGQTECGVEPCVVLSQCRGPDEPYYQPGDKYHSLALCESVIGGLTRRPREHHEEQGSFRFPKSQRGLMEFITTHECRACRVDADGDPCARHYVALVRRPDGYFRPALFSEPYADASRNRWNFGFFTKQRGEDPMGRVPAGYGHIRVGLENRPWSELAVYADKMRCGINE